MVRDKTKKRRWEENDSWSKKAGEGSKCCLAAMRNEMGAADWGEKKDGKAIVGCERTVVEN